MAHYQHHFPKTNFIIGVRHPVKWFESFYNFRVNNRFKMPHANKLVGGCMRGFHNVCTKRAAFHVYLSRMGKTDISPEERKLLKFGQFPVPLKLMNTTARVFLYDTEQLDDSNQTRARMMRQDLQSFLGLRNALPPMVHYKPGKSKWDNYDNATQQHLQSMKIDICDEQYLPLRTNLMMHAVHASQWIRQHFLQSDDVVVSSREHFEQILLSWEHDPCDLSEVNLPNTTGAKLHVE